MRPNNDIRKIIDKAVEKSSGGARNTASTRVRGNRGLLIVTGGTSGEGVDPGTTNVFTIGASAIGGLDYIG